MDLNTDTRGRRDPRMLAAASRSKGTARRNPAADVHAFVDRLLYGGWLEDSRRDAIKLQMIRAIAEWANGGARS
jgi:hypothetical protein